MESHGTSPTITILYVEDEVESRAIVMELLSSQYPHVQLISATDGREGVELFRRLRPDIVVTDVQMPLMSGLEMTREILEIAPGTCIIAVTAYSDMNHLLEAIKLGVTRYVLKPVDYDRLVEAVDDCMSRIVLERQVREQQEHIRKLSRALEQSPGVIVITDLDGTIEYVNAKFTEVTGYTLPEVVGENVRILKSGATPQATYRELWSAIGSGHDWHGEFVNRKKSGEIYFEAASISPVKDPDGTITHYVAVKQDITEQKRMEAESLWLASFPQLNPYPILELDAEANMTYCNPAAAEVLRAAGLRDDPGPFLPDDIGTIIHELSRQEDTTFLRQVEIDENVFEVLICLAPSYGTVRLYTTDITERKRAEERQARLAAIVESTDDAIIGKTLDGIITNWNRGAEQVFGFPAEEVLGNSIDLFIPPERRAEELTFLDNIGRGERVKNFETVRITRSGARLDVLLTMSPIVDQSGEIIGASTIARDISDRKRAEAERERLLLQQEAVLQSINEGVVVADLEGHILIMNQEALALHELTHGEQARRHVTGFEESFLLFDLQGNPLTLQEWPLSRALRGERFDDYEVVVRSRVEGKEWIGSYSGTPVLNREGEAILAVITVRDISERKRLEEKVAALNRDLAARASELETVNGELETFNYTVAHDLRKPLTVINGYCQAIMEFCGGELSEECRRYLQETYEGTLRMNHLIDSLLEFSRLVHAEPRRETVDLSEMAAQVARELALAEPERRVIVRIQPGVVAEGDPDLLRVVLNNLLGNAWKYSHIREEALIEVGVTEMEGVRCYFVRDNGVGFPMVEAQTAFAPFKRLSGAEGVVGVGVGLATVARIIKHHGGRIWAESEPDQGATFSFTLE